MDWQLVIAAAGLALGAFNLLGWWIERRDRKAALAEERRLREEETELSRRRHALEFADRDARRHAQIAANWLPRNTTQGDPLSTFDFALKNLGPCWARDVYAWLVIDEAFRSEEEITPGTPPMRLWASPPTNVGALDAGEAATAHCVVAATLIAKRPDVKLWIDWVDESGKHVKRFDFWVKLWRD
jgi:hypothetical protein